MCVIFFYMKRGKFYVDFLCYILSNEKWKIGKVNYVYENLSFFRLGLFFVCVEVFVFLLFVRIGLVRILKF